jgi:hypothetical protein
LSEARRGSGVALAWALAAMLAGGSFAARYRVDFDPSGEGFLWYGTTRVRHGEVPLRDFRSYDAGRYYWGALWARALGDGVVAQRAAAAAFQGLGLALALLAARREVKGWGLAGVGAVLTVWMWPPDKLYDTAVAMAAVWVLVRMLEQPSPRRYLVVGLFVGLAAWIGRNHGLYTLVPVLAAGVWLERHAPARTRAARLVSLAAGITVGYLPQIVLCLLAPGFFTSFLVSNASHLVRGSNIPLPVPWPWTTKWSDGWRSGVWWFSLGICFVGYVAFLLTASAAIARRPAELVRARPLLVAATLVALGYAHYVSVRSDLAHLATAMGPVVLGMVPLIGLLRERHGRAPALIAWSAVTVLTVTVPGRRQPAAEAVLKWPALVERDIAGDRLWIDRNTAGVIQLVRQVARPLPPGATVLLAPNMPGLYCVLGQRSPVWDILPIWPADVGDEERMVREMEKSRVAVAVLHLAPVGHPDWGFPRTHPQVWQHVQASFVRAPTSAGSGGLAVFVRPGTGGDLPPHESRPAYLR